MDLKRKSVADLLSRQIAFKSVNANTASTLGAMSLKLAFPPGHLAVIRTSALLATIIRTCKFFSARMAHGTKCRRRLQISFVNGAMTGILPAKLSMRWFDKSAKQWINRDGADDATTKTVSVPVWHFTAYMLSSWWVMVQF